MPRNVDQNHDKNFTEFSRLEETFGIPDFVKTATMADIEGYPANSDYADVPRKQYPCHTQAATYVSAMFYQDKRAEFHPSQRELIDKRFDYFANYFKIMPEINQIRAKHAELVKSASYIESDSNFLYVKKATDAKGNAITERHLPVRSATEVKRAEQWLFENRDKIGFETKRQIADNLLTKAASYGVMLGNFEAVEQMAGRGVCDPDKVYAMISNRALLTKNAELKGVLQEMARTVRNSPSIALHPGSLTKLATTIDQFDTIMNIRGNYNQTITRPEEVIFEVTYSKTASAVEALVETTSGKMYTIRDFNKVAVDELRSALGDEFVSLVTTPLGDIDTAKMAEQVSALPRPEAETFDGIMREAGIRPAVLKAATVRHGLSEADMKDWTDVYTKSCDSL